jgi:hypothetical protein
LLATGQHDTRLRELHELIAGLCLFTLRHPLYVSCPFLLCLNAAVCRILVKLRDWRLSSIEIVGTQPLPGITYTHRFRNGGSKELPVLPSDHFGLLLKVEPV